VIDYEYLAEENLANMAATCSIHLTPMTTALRRESELCNSKRWVDVIAPAKINLYLEILGRRLDGFHELETVMSAVNWYDRIRFVARNDDQIRLYQMNSDPIHSGVPTDERNLIVRALNLLRKKIAEEQLPGCDVLLYKEVPSEAGLGGASSNAAAALLAGRILWKSDISDSLLQQLAEALGSDVPFFLRGGSALCRGRGERIESLPARGAIPIVIVKPPSGLSTREVYSHVQLSAESHSSEAFLSGYLDGCLSRIGKQLFNRLSETALLLNDQVAEVSELFKRTTSLGHQVSGSGSSYFGLFETTRAARQAARRLANQLPQAKIVVGLTLGSARPGISVRV
jgi:4-diphosphocytidyl-2-C-methyl-D-erythritol kinase